MNKFKQVVPGLMLALGMVGGCATEGVVPDPMPAPAAAVANTPVLAAEAEDELAALRALDVVEVRELLVAVPDEATACYLLPCAGWEDEVAAEVARQMPRLQRFQQLAAEAAAAHDDTAPGDSVADLQALRDLHLVGIGALIQRQPQAEANCYNLPCPGEVERVDAENRARAATVTRLAKTTKGL